MKKILYCIAILISTSLCAQSSECEQDESCYTAEDCNKCCTNNGFEIDPKCRRNCNECKIQSDTQDDETRPK